MSAPNKSFDPVEVEVLKPEAVERARDEALAAIAASADLDALHEAEIAHAKDRSPLALANREIGALAPAAKAEAGRDARVLVEESVDVTLPWDRAPRGARHPLTTLTERIAEVFGALGWEVN